LDLAINVPLEKVKKVDTINRATMSGIREIRKDYKKQKTRRL